MMAPVAGPSGEPDRSAATVPEGVTMSNKDRVGHNPKRKPARTQAEKRQAKREKRQELKSSSKRKRRNAAAHHTNPR